MLAIHLSIFETRQIVTNALFCLCPCSLCSRQMTPRICRCQICTHWALSPLWRFPGNKTQPQTVSCERSLRSTWNVWRSRWRSALGRYQGSVVELGSELPLQQCTLQASLRIQTANKNKKQQLKIGCNGLLLFKTTNYIRTFIKTTLEGKIEGGGARAIQLCNWEDNITRWTNSSHKISR